MAVLVLRGARPGPQVDQAATAILEQDHDEVRRTGGEGSLTTLCRTDAQDGGGNEHVGETDKQEGDGQHQDAHNIEDGLVHTDVRTGQAQDWGHVAQKVVDFLAVPTEGQHEDQGCELQGEEDGQPHGAHDHLDTQLLGHDEAVVQRVADGHVSIIGHDCQEKTVSAAKGDKEEHLSPTTCQWNGLLGPQNVGKHQGHHNRGVADFQERQMGQKEIHWCAEGAVCAHHPDDGSVATKDHQVEEEEEEEEEHLELRDSCEYAEHKHSGVGLVEHRVPIQHVSCEKKQEG